MVEYPKIIYKQLYTRRMIKIMMIVVNNLFDVIGTAISLNKAKEKISQLYNQYSLCQWQIQDNRIKKHRLTLHAVDVVM